MHRIVSWSVVAWSLSTIAGAGDMKAVVKAGVLTITDSAGDDLLAVDQAGIMDPTTFRLTSGPGTTVNGSAVAQTFPGVTKDIRFVHSGGTDEDVISTLTVPRDLIVQAAALDSLELTFVGAVVDRDLKIDSKASVLDIDTTMGGGSIIKRDVKISTAATVGTIADLAPLFVTRNLTWKGGALPDLIELGNSTHVGGTVSLDLGGGSDQVLQDDTVHIGGPMKIKAKTGMKQVTLSGSYHGDVNCDFGACDSVTATVDAVAISGMLNLKLGSGATHAATISSTSVGGGVDVQSKGDIDSIVLSGAAVGGDARFKLGPGSNTVSVSALSQIGGDLLYFGSAASDDVSLAQSTTYGDVLCQLGPAPAGLDDGFSGHQNSIYGNLRITGTSGMHSGSLEDSGVFGEARISYGSDANGFTFDGGGYKSITMIGTSGPDTFVITGGALVAHHEITVLLGDGNNMLDVANTTCIGNVTVKAGNGDDDVSITSVTVLGDTLVDLGGGTNVGP